LLIVGLEVARLMAALLRHPFSIARRDEMIRAVKFYRAAVALELGFINTERG